MRSKILISAVGLSLLISGASVKSQVKDFKSVLDNREVAAKTTTVGNSKIFSTSALSDSLKSNPVSPVWSKAPLDSIYLEMMRNAFIDEISKIRQEGGQTPIVAERHFTRHAQKYADTLATLPNAQISHDVTEQAERLSWLLPLAKSVQECIYAGPVFSSLSDTLAMLHEVRQAARDLMTSPPHGKSILAKSFDSNGRPTSGLGGVGIVLCKSPNSSDHRLVVVYMRGSSPIPSLNADAIRRARIPRKHSYKPAS